MKRHFWRSEKWIRAACFTVIAVYLGAVAWITGDGSYDVWGGLVAIPVLILLTLPLARHAARQEDDALMAKIIMLALVLKLLGGVVRYAAAFDFYGGKADATAYHLAGVQIEVTELSCREDAPDFQTQRHRRLVPRHNRRFQSEVGGFDVTAPSS